MTVASVLLDREEGSRAERGTAGSRVIRIAHVQGLTASTGTEKLWEATTASDGVTSIPAVGDAHPSSSTMKVTRVSAEPLGPADAARVVIEYEFTPATGAGGGAPDPGDGSISDGVIQVGASTTTVRTQLDKDGAPLEVTFSAWTKTDETTQIGEAEIEVPQPVLRRVRTETVEPSATKLGYVGTVNNATIWGYAARTLLCRRIEGVSTDGGLTWEVTYEFQLRPQTWDQQIPFRDPTTGQPAAGITTSDGIATHQVFPTSTWASIGIEF